jgi:hypothetical protein
MDDHHKQPNDDKENRSKANKADDGDENFKVEPGPVKSTTIAQNQVQTHTETQMQTKSPTSFVSLSLKNYADLFSFKATTQATSTATQDH